MHSWNSETSDGALLQSYLDENAEDAFAEIVRRRLPLVYSTVARRLEGDRAGAEDVAQSVFVEFARRARALTQHPTIAGWLYTTASRMAADHWRRNQRQRMREQTPMKTDEPTVNAELEWAQLKPVLDDVLRDLEEEDRHAVVLRYLEQREFLAIGRELGLSADAARMRVARALDKLRMKLVKRGIISGAVALETLLAQQSIQTVPNGLAASIGNAVRELPVAGLPAGLFSAASRKLTVAALLVLIGAGGGLLVQLRRHETREASAAAARRIAANPNTNSGTATRVPRPFGPLRANRQARPADPIVTEALGYLRSALFDLQLEKSKRFQLLERSTGLLVGRESETIPLFREAFSSRERESMVMALEGIGHFGSLPGEFGPELLAMLENVEFKAEAGLIANRLIPALVTTASPVGTLMGLLQRRPDLHEPVEYLLIATIGAKPEGLAENREAIEAMSKDPNDQIQQAAVKILAETPEPLPPSLAPLSTE